MFDFEFVSYSFQMLPFQTLCQCLCWIQNTNLRCLASSIPLPPLSCTVDFWQALFMGAAQIFRIVGGTNKVGPMSLWPTLPVLEHSYQIYFPPTRPSVPLTFPPLTCQMIQMRVPQCFLKLNAKIYICYITKFNNHSQILCNRDYSKMSVQQ